MYEWFSNHTNPARAEEDMPQPGFVKDNKVLYGQIYEQWTCQSEQQLLLYWHIQVSILIQRV